MILGKKPILNTETIGFKVDVFHVMKGKKDSFLVFDVHGSSDYCTVVSCVETILHTHPLPSHTAAIIVSDDVFGAYQHSDATETIDSKDNAITTTVFSFLKEMNMVPKPVREVKDNVSFIKK